MDLTGQKSSWQTGHSSEPVGTWVKSYKVLNGDHTDFWEPDGQKQSFAWLSVDMTEEKLVLEVKIYVRAESGCCHERGANLEVRVGNEEPSAIAEEGERFR